MKLQRITEHVYIYPPEREKDRPMLGYVRGSNLSMAIDAGFSPVHVRKFYRAIKEKHFAIPDITVITHWHWDHSLGSCAVNGSLIMNELTAQLIREENDRLADEKYQRKLKAQYSYVGEEFTNRNIPFIRKADEVFSDKIKKDLGGITAEIFHSDAPHTDDSTLIWIPEDSVLFIGDAMYGNYFTGHMDIKKMACLSRAMESHMSRYILSGHEGLIDA